MQCNISATVFIIGVYIFIQSKHFFFTHMKKTKIHTVNFSGFQFGLSLGLGDIFTPQKCKHGKFRADKFT